MPKVTANPIQLTQDGQKQIAGVESWVKTVALDDRTFGLQWNPERLSPWRNGFQKGQFPSYFKHEGNKVMVVTEESVPESSGLKTSSFPSPNMSESYVPSHNGEGVWKKPGPRSGPLTAKLADDSVVTYYWYRFIDQPAMQNAGLSSAQREKLQSLVEKMHRNWTPDKQYMAPPSRGKLAAVDAALLVKPPKGLEIGFVPVAMRQDPAKK